MWQIQDPALIFSVLMLTFLFAPLLAEKLKIPELVLLLIAGVIFGPNGIGILNRSGGIELFGSIGLLYIMFVAGLETDANHFRNSAKRSAFFGLVTFLIPQILGTIIGRYLLGYSWVSSVLMASMFASHTLVAYPIASKLGLARSEGVVVTVSGTILTDTLALLVLAVVGDYTKGASLGFSFWGSLALGITILVVSIWFLLPLIANWFFRNVPEKGGAQFVFVLGMVCLCAYWSHYAKMEPIIGAFLAGVAFNRLIPEQSILSNRLIFVGNTFFIPFFLISVGMLINPALLFSSFNGAMVALVMTLTVIVAKFIAAEITSKTFGYSSSERNVIFGLSVSQAAATLAVVLVGHKMKIFDDDVLNGTVIMILISCSLGCQMVSRYGKLAANNAKMLSSSTLSRKQRIMVGLANVSSATKLFEFSMLLRNINHSPEILPVAVINDHSEEEHSEKIAKGEELLSKCMSMATAVDVSITPSIRLSPNISDGLVRYSIENRCSLAILGWDGKVSYKFRVFNSISDNMRSNCPARLYFCRLTHPLNTCKRIILPIPNLSYKRIDLKTLIDDAYHLALQIGSSLYVDISPEFPPSAMKQLNKLSSSCKIEINISDSLEQLCSRIIEDLSKNDLLFLPLERRESPLWNLSLERFASSVFKNFSETNIIAAYPPLIGNTTSDDKEELAEENNQVLAMQLSSSNIFIAINDMLKQIPNLNDLQEQKLRSSLKESLKKFPFEISNNVLLLHTRSVYVNNTTLIVGRNFEPYKISSLQGNYKIIILLISPDGDYEHHLNELSKLARKFMTPEFEQKLLNAESIEQMKQLF